MTGPLLLTLACAASADPAVLPVGPRESRWTTGFAAERFNALHKTGLPAMTRLLTGTEKSQFLVNFEIAAGKAKGTHRGPAWNDGDTYKWLEAVLWVYAATLDESLRPTIDSAVATIAAAQRADGYLHTPVLIANRNGDATKRPFGDRFDFEMYNFGHLFTASAVHHEVTKSVALLTVAEKAAAYLAKSFDRPTEEQARNTVCPSHFMGLVDLHRVTGKKQYLDLAVKLFEMRSQITDGGDDNQDRLPFRKQTRAVGHAVRANYLYAGAADLLLATGDDTLRGPIEAVWNNLVSRKLYPTGGCGALYDGASPDGSKEQKQITRVHQAYGRDYQLPNETAHNETCAAIGLMLWNERMLARTGEAKYAELNETTYLNAVLAGVSLDGAKHFYTNALRRTNDFPVPLRWSRDRASWISCYCCPPNVARTVARSANLAFGRSPSAVWVHGYGGSELATMLPDGGRFVLTQTTDYPWDGRVRIAIQDAPARDVTLNLRIPAWATGATLGVNGKPVNVTPGTYANVKRTWAKGDMIGLMLPMQPVWREANPHVEETRGQAFAACGPLVYCLESPDLPNGVSLRQIAVSTESKLIAKKSDRLGGTNVLAVTGTATVTAPWANDLYRDVTPTLTKPVPFTLVPYALWNNRGPGEMSVWLPATKGPP